MCQEFLNSGKINNQYYLVYFLVENQIWIVIMDRYPNLKNIQTGVLFLSNFCQIVLLTFEVKVS